MTNDKRLIETAFPLTEASAASLHEKNVRHGHISTLHLWPARRPLAASRAAIAAALTPDPGTDEERARFLRRLGGKLVPKTQGKVENGRAVEVDKVEAEGGILWWGNESSPDLDWFRQQILKSTDGRPPRVLDPFSGGGAIPLEAMRLGCEVVANDLNPVAWLLLRCTLEYPYKLAGKTLPLPPDACADERFATAFLKAQGLKGSVLKNAVSRMVSGNDEAGVLKGVLGEEPWRAAALGWHVRAWGNRVLADVRRELSSRYPTYAEWQTLDSGTTVEPRALTLLEPDEDGHVSADGLNADLSAQDLEDPRIPRWVPKPTIAYLWARTVPCKTCRVDLPLIRTLWLCRRDEKRVALEIKPNEDRTGVVVSVRRDVPLPTGTAAQRKEADRQIGLGTMSRTGAKCPCCGNFMTMSDLQYEAKAGRFGSVMTCVVVDGPRWKEYRDPTEHEIAVADIADGVLTSTFDHIPFGIPTEPMSTKRPSPNTRGVTAPTRYGLDHWDKLFTKRQLVMMGSFVNAVRSMPQAMEASGYPEEWREALWAYLALAVDRLADYGSSLCSWDQGREGLRNTFARFALAMVWDYCEINPLSGFTGDFKGAVEWIGKAIDHTTQATANAGGVSVNLKSALETSGEFDAVITDPPYYDAIPYSDCMDFFHVWLRRTLFGASPEIDAAFASALGPKWNHEAADGELIDDVSRFNGDGEASKKNFEDGMAKVLRRCADSLRPSGQLILVFANKSPAAWETLVGAVIRAGFLVECSLPIQTEMANRSNALTAAALSSSVWLVCRKRPASARPGWSVQVLEEMRQKISEQMRRFWDAGIRGPDFVWAATGPALEAYSRHPVVFREAASAGKAEPMPVAEFLREVRRLVVEFAVGRVLKGDESSDEAASLDDITTYYLLHRHSFGMEEAPVGACILYAVSCGLSDSALVDQFEILASSGRSAQEISEDGDGDESEGGDAEASEGSGSGGSKVRLRRWDQRKRKTLGLEGVGGRPVSIIDRVHRLMRLWKDGDLAKVDQYLGQASLTRDPLFAQVIQAIIELARRDGKGDEASLLESISNHLQSRSGVTAPRQASMF